VRCRTLKPWAWSHVDIDGGFNSNQACMDVCFGFGTSHCRPMAGLLYFKTEGVPVCQMHGEAHYLIIEVLSCLFVEICLLQLLSDYLTKKRSRLKSE